MIKKIKYLFKVVLKRLNIGVTTYKNLKLLKESKEDNSNLMKLSKEDLLNLIATIDISKSQLKQDLFVLHQLNFKKNGFFVEFGASNGVDLSNTYILEKEYNWNGILAEPAKCWHTDLKLNRNCYIDTNCVWKNSSTVLNFNETEYKELSTISSFNNSDNNKKDRLIVENYNVNSISLIDLLNKYNAPKIIDYLSIDTEGSEYEILLNFDFSKYTFRVITCEHNYTKNREKIYKLLKKKGYIRKFSSISKWDDWYVKI